MPNVIWYSNAHRLDRFSCRTVDAEEFNAEIRIAIRQYKAKHDVHRKDDHPDKKQPLLFVAPVGSIAALKSIVDKQVRGNVLKRMFGPRASKSDKDSLVVTELTVLPPSFEEIIRDPEKSIARYASVISFLRDPVKMAPSYRFVYLSIPDVDLSDAGRPLFHRAFAMGSIYETESIKAIVAGTRNLASSNGGMNEIIMHVRKPSIARSRSTF